MGEGRVMEYVIPLVFIGLIALGGLLSVLATLGLLAAGMADGVKWLWDRLGL